MDHDNIASVFEEDAQSFVKVALNKGKDMGFYKGYRYLLTENEEDDTIIFLNAERELQNMKTPLTSILASADILDMEQEDNEWVQNIRQQSGYLSRLIQNLITLSRLDEENPFPEKSEFSLSDAVWEIAEPFSSLAKARHKEYTQHIEDGLALVGDRAAIQQMVSILLDNAMKYSEENGRISLLVQKSSGRVKGTGIGLSIAKATAEAHGGSIKASYQKDGILFRVVL